MKLYGVLYKYFPDEEYIVDDKLYRERTEAEKRMDEFGLAKNAEQQYSIKKFDIDIEDYIENRIKKAIKDYIEFNSYEWSIEFLQDCYGFHKGELCPVYELEIDWQRGTKTAYILNKEGQKRGQTFHMNNYGYEWKKTEPYCKLIQKKTK